MTVSPFTCYSLTHGPFTINFIDECVTATIETQTIEFPEVAYDTVIPSPVVITAFVDDVSSSYTPDICGPKSYTLTSNESLTLDTVDLILEYTQQD